MIIDDIKSRLNIIELAKAEGLQLKKQSKRIYKAVCCFHIETKASLTFYTDTNEFHCFSCKAGKDPINFYAKRHYSHLSDKQANSKAIKELARQLGLTTSFKGLNRAKRGSLLAVTGRSRGFESIGEVLKGKESYFSQQDIIYRALREFCGELDKESRDYLTGASRGLTDETIKKFNIFSIKDYKTTRCFLLRKFALKDLKELLLFDSINRFSFNKNKIIIPVLEDGKIIALRGRYFDKGVTDPEEVITTYNYPKYKTTKVVAKKLFNADILKTLKRGERVYLCEGEFDTMILSQHGKNAVGVLGAGSYDEQLIKKLNDFDLVIAFDNKNVEPESHKHALKISNIFYKQTGREVIREKLPDSVKDITELFILKARQKVQ